MERLAAVAGKAFSSCGRTGSSIRCYRKQEVSRRRRTICHGGQDVLKRRSIRTKLIIALTLLSAIVLLLAFSGFWGLHRYRRLADAVSQRAIDIPYANELNRHALTIRESNLRTREIRTHEGMINSASLVDPL